MFAIQTSIHWSADRVNVLCKHLQNVLHFNMMYPRPWCILHPRWKYRTRRVCFSVYVKTFWTLTRKGIHCHNILVLTNKRKEFIFYQQNHVIFKNSLNPIVILMNWESRHNLNELQQKCNICQSLNNWKQLIQVHYKWKQRIYYIWFWRTKHE